VEFDPVRAKAAGRPRSGMDADTAALFPDCFQDSPLGKIPSGWRTGTLDEIADVIMGTSPPGDTYNEDGIGTPLVNGPVEFGDRFPTPKKWTTASQVVDVGLEQLLSRITGSVFPNLNGPDIKGFQILLPPEVIIRRYCTVVAPELNLVNRNCKQSSSLAAIRDALLPKLLSGDVRVGEAERAVQEARR